jgi:hypothetical protein
MQPGSRPVPNSDNSYSQKGIAKAGRLKQNVQFTFEFPTRIHVKMVIIIVGEV